MKNFFLSVFFAFIAGFTNAQEFKILKINTSQYPEITATFMATDPKGSKILNAQPSDFNVSENNSKAEVLSVLNPNEVPVPVSVVLVFDNSLSMAGSRLNMALQAGRYFIDQMPLETSEIAVASFSDKVFVNCDFTQDHERLLNALEQIRTIGGTSYDEAFMNETSGALSLAKNGRFKKYVIFLTDGLSHTDPDKVISAAKAQNTTVFVVTLELVTPGILKEISTKTGGTYFQTNADSKNLESIYSSIFQMLEIRKYGSIMWIAPPDCRRQKNVQLVFRGISLKIDYNAPEDKTGRLEADPSLLMFGIAKANVKKNLSFDLIARNIPITLTSLTLPPNSPFSVTDTIHLPYRITPNEVKSINLTYNPSGNKRITEKMIVSSKECDRKEIMLTGGTDEELRLICPHGGETFVTGTDTSIRWEGMRRDRYMNMFYRVNPRREWIRIGQAKDLYYQWKVPRDTGRQLQVRIETAAGSDGSLYLTSIIPDQRGGFRNLSFNADGDKLLTTDQTGSLKIWNVKDGNEIAGLNSATPKGYAVFGPDEDQILFFNRSEIITWSQKSQKNINRQNILTKVVLTPFLLTDGTTRMITTRWSTDSANALKLWIPELNLTRIIFSNEQVIAAGLSPDGLKAITLSGANIIKIWDNQSGKGFKSRINAINPQGILFSPNSKTAIINALGIITIMNMSNGAELFHFNRYTPPVYSKSGDMLMLDDQSKTIFIDTYTGKPLFSIYKHRFYETFKDGYKILYFRNDSLTLFDAKKRLNNFRNYMPNVSDISLSPDDKRIMVIRNNNIIEFYDTANGKRINRITGLDNGIQKAFFNPNNKGIVVLMKNNSLQYWSTEGSEDKKEAVSGYFTVVSPRPIVKRLVDFKSQDLFSPKELTVENFITNPTPYPVKITGIELLSGDASDFAIVSGTDPFIVNGGKSKEAEFRFVPSSVGARKLFVRTCTPTDTFITTLTGTGTSRIFEVSRIIRFGKVKVNASRDSAATIIRNTGNLPLEISSLENFGPDKKQFSFQHKEKYSLLPEDSLILKIRFSPAFRGKTTGNLALNINGEMHFIQLEGEGTAPQSILLAGKTLNSNDSLPLQSEVNLIDLESGSVLKRVTSGGDGNFRFPVNADRNYGIIAIRNGYISTSENIDIRIPVLKDTIYRDLYLTLIKPGAVVRMNCIFFEFAKANLLDDSRNELDRMAEFLNERKNITVEIQGHTDSIGSDADNMILSGQRANSVRNYLIKKGIDPNRMVPRFFGESQPVTGNNTEEGRQRNRRVEIKINSIQ